LKLKHVVTRGERGNLTLLRRFRNTKLEQMRIVVIGTHELTNNANTIKLQVEMVAQQRLDEGVGGGGGKAEPPRNVPLAMTLEGGYNFHRQRHVDIKSSPNFSVVVTKSMASRL